MVLGETDLVKFEESEQVLEVVGTIIHEKYKETTDSVYNDIGEYNICIVYVAHIFVFSRGLRKFDILLYSVICDKIIICIIFINQCLQT